MLRVRRLGRVTYDEAWALQRALAVHTADDYLLLLHHPHTYTLGVHADASHVLVDPASVGAELRHCDRGGDVTYHGPGQLVLYPVVTVPGAPGAARRHVHALEDVVIATLRELGAGAAEGVGRLDGRPGVWVGAGGPRPRKIAAVGVRTLGVRGPAGRRTRTLHGVALNVDCDLAMFGHIVPCGIADLAVTSLRAEGSEASFDQVADVLESHARARWSAPGTTTDRQAVREGPASPSAAAPAAPPGRTPLALRLDQAGAGGEGLPLSARKPEWLRVPVRRAGRFDAVARDLRGLDLVTVCQEAGCPNIYECWSEGTATFMVNGSRCTRACAFCLVDTRRPLPVDAGEPARVAEAVDRLGLAHAVVTCVARDDLADGGAGAIAETVAAIRSRRPGTRVEVLVSDCKGDASALDTIFAARPDVFNHNIETVARLQRAVRPSAGYARSLATLARAGEAGLVTKSGMMVGLGECEDEVVSTLADLAAVGVSVATVGQYLRPSARHAPVARWWAPEEFERLAAAGRALGLAHVEASPRTRSSYHAKAAADAAGRATDGATDGATDQTVARREVGETSPAGAAAGA